MIKSRAEILNINHCFAEHLITVQKAKYEPSDEWSEGDSVFLDDSDKATILTKEHAAKLNTEDLKYFLDNKDQLEVQNSNIWDGRTTLVSSKKNATDYLNEIGQVLAELSKKFGRLLILGDWNTTWLYQKNEYPPVQTAVKYLSLRIDENFNGGFALDSGEITEFIPHLFWLTRCNASLPEFMMTFESSNTVYGLCKHGVLHLEYYDSIERKELLKLFSELKFKQIGRCVDPVDFDQMDGRQVIISN